MLLGNMGGVPSMKFDGVRIYGLLRRLKCIFYPHYNYETARHIDRTVPKGEYTFPHAADGARKGGKSHSLGAVRGSAVDADLRLWVNNPLLFKQQKSHPAMCADIIQAFEIWGWKGICSQFPLVAEEIKVWTGIDMIVRNQDGIPILLELKTGYRDYLYRYTGMMEGPLSDLPDTPMNQHFLQVGLEWLMALYCYGYRFPQAFVIQAVNELGVTPHPLPAWFYERERAIWEYFTQRVRAGVGTPAPAPQSRAPAAHPPRRHPTAGGRFRRRKVKM